MTEAPIETPEPAQPLEPAPASRYEVDVRSPQDSTSHQREEFMALVRAGREVRPSTLPALVENALALAFVRLDTALVAVGGLKRPNTDYRGKAFAKAEIADPGRYPFELGWVYIDPAHRANGLSGRIVTALVERLGDARAYATSLTGNDKMHSSLRKAGFVQSGKPYPSTRKGEVLVIFLRDSSLEQA